MVLRAPKGYIADTDSRVAKFGHPAPAWLFPYADLMTELVCFFVILYALGAALNKDVQQTKKDIEEMMDKEEIAGEVKIDKEGLKFSLEEQKETAHFQSGFAELTPEMKATLDKIAPKLLALANKDHEIVIEGHTDDIPIHNDYFWSNWELSAARATSVVEYFTTKKGFPAGCMGAIGYGEHRPIARNDSPANRARNRRVVFFVKNLSLKREKCAQRTARGPGPPGGASDGDEEDGES
ncbi:flagellar motor protein MotB [Elusimicrobiota bacterium]